jgi:hypothetical protein
MKDPAWNDHLIYALGFGSLVPVLDSGLTYLFFPNRFPNREVLRYI